MINWNKVEKEIKKLLNKNTHLDMLSFAHGIEPIPLCFTTKEEYENFFKDLIKYLQKLKKENQRKRGENKKNSGV